MEIMKTIGINPTVIRAGNANMFLSPVFRDTLSGLSGATIELYDTDGSQGAAKGAGIGAGIYSGPQEAFKNLKQISLIKPDKSKSGEYQAAYQQWLKQLKSLN